MQPQYYMSPTGVVYRGDKVPPGLYRVIDAEQWDRAGTPTSPLSRAERRAAARTKPTTPHPLKKNRKKR